MIASDPASQPIYMVVEPPVATESAPRAVNANAVRVRPKQRRVAKLGQRVRRVREGPGTLASALGWLQIRHVGASHRVEQRGRLPESAGLEERLGLRHGGRNE